MREQYHPRNKVVIEELKSIPNRDSFFKRLFFEKAYDPQKVIELFKKETDFEISKDSLIDTYFILEDPKSERYESFQDLGEYMCKGVPLVHKLFPSKFWFENPSRRGLILSEEKESILETKIGKIPEKVKLVEVSSLRDVEILLEHEFQLRTHSKEHHKVNGEDEWGTYFNYEYDTDIYTLTR